MTQLVIPLAPVAWQRVKTGRYGQSYVPPATRRFKNEFVKLARKYAPQEPWGGAIKLTIVFFIKRPKRPKCRAVPMTRPDLDNYLKGVLDACNGIFWVDDGQVVEFFVAKEWALDGKPRIHMQVEELA